VLGSDILVPGAGPVADPRMVLTLVDGDPVFADANAVNW
jgi:hypothetical protein